MTSNFAASERVQQRQDGVRRCFEVLRVDLRQPLDRDAAMGRAARLRIGRAGIDRDVMAPGGEVRRQFLHGALDATIGRGNTA